MIYSEIMDLVFDNLKKIVFPEEWLNIDMTLSKHEVFTLMLVDRRGEIIMSQIADYVNVSMSTATGIVDRLVKNGFLERNRIESDRRIVMITLTEKAKNLVNDIKNIGSRYFSLVSDALTEEERTFMYKLFLKIMGIINKHHANTPEATDNLEVKRIAID